MIDPTDDRLVRANPVPASAVGAIHGDAARALVQAITAERVPRRRSARRRLALALVVALAVGAPVAFAAARSHLFDLVLGSPAPKQARTTLDQMLPSAYGPKEGPPQWRTRTDIIRGSERLVDELTTSTGAHARMYAVRLRGGGACWFTTGIPFDGGGCGGRAIHDATAIGGGIGMMFAHMGKRRPGTFGQGVTLAGPVGAHGATRMRVDYRDGSTTFVPVVRGWVMYEVPLAHTFWRHEPTRIDVLDAHGHVLATQNDPFSLHRAAQPTIEQALEPHVLLARQALGWKGASVELLFARGSRGSGCIQARNTGRLHWTERWLCDPAVGHDSALTILRPIPTSQAVYVAWGRFTQFGRSSGYAYAYGWAGPSVASVEIRYQDSTVQRLPFVRRFFLYVVPRRHWVLGERPSYLVARAADGRVLYERFLYPKGHCAYPGPDPACAHSTVEDG